MFDLLIFIGRFQPFHNGHKRVIDEALEKAKKVLVLVGSAGAARNIRNPFTFEERKQMIFDSYLQRDLQDDTPATSRVIIRPLFDKTYNDTAWTKQVQDLVKEEILNIVNPHPFRPLGLNDVKVGLIGASKDHTSFYLKMFPQFDSVNVPIDENVLHATDLRKAIFFDRCMEEDIEDLVPPAVTKFLFGDGIPSGFIDSPEYEQLEAEWEFCHNYKEQWKDTPYPVQFQTVDAVTEQSAHILLVKRRSEPGKGLWALPGGHLNPRETCVAGMIRELREETGLKVPDPVLRGSIVANKRFDDPERSNIGRVITDAFHIKLTDQLELPRVKGADDAEKAKWIPVTDIREDMLFDDHYHIIQYFLGV